MAVYAKKTAEPGNKARYEWKERTLKSGSEEKVTSFGKTVGIELFEARQDGVKPLIINRDPSGVSCSVANLFL